MALKLSDIKSQIANSGSNRGKFLYFKDGTKVRVRFLTDFEDGTEIKFHDSFALSVNVPCQEQYGKECPYCEMEGLRTRNQYAWSVYDYEAKETKIFMMAVNNCSPIPALASLYESIGTLTDRDFEIKQIGSKQSKTFTVIPMEKRVFRGKAKALSEQAIMKAVAAAYPADEVGDDEEDEKTKKKQNRTKVKPEPESEPDEEWEDEEDESNDYESMSAKELYKLCKEREIDCKPKKSKEYYIDLLESADEEDEGWGEEDGEDDDW